MIDERWSMLFGRWQFPAYYFNVLKIIDELYYFFIRDIYLGGIWFLNAASYGKN